MAGTTTIQPEDKTRVLYDAVSKKYDIGSYDEFKNKLQDPSKRKAFYDGVGKEYDLGSYDEFQQKIGTLKKKDTADGSVFPSDSSQKSVQTAQHVSTSGSDPKQFTSNFKNNSLTPKDVSDPRLGIAFGPSLDQISGAINNKGKNIDKWSKSPSNLSTSFLVKEKQDVDGKIANMDSFQNRVMAGKEGQIENYDNELNTLKARKEYLDGEIDKSYKFQKEKLVPELAEDVKKSIGEDKIQFNPDTHTITEKSARIIADYVDEVMNKKNDPYVNAATTGDLDQKKRTYPDLTRSVIDQLNIIPIKRAQDEFTDDFAKKNPKLKEALDANKEVHDYFSAVNYDDLNAKIKVQADKSFINTQQRYYGEGGVFQKNQDYVSIQHKYAQLVSEGKMSDSVAKSQMEAEIKNNPELKKIKSGYDDEIRRTIESTQKQYENYLIQGLKKEHPQYTTYKDGTIGLASMSEDQYKNMMEGYQEGMDGIAKKMGAESNAAWMKRANDRAKIAGPLWGSLGSSLNEIESGLIKMVFNKTGWGGEKVRNFEASDIASPSVSQSDVAATWNFKGWESLLNPNFYLSSVGQMVPVIAGGAAVELTTEGAGTPEYISWLANAGLFTAQSSLSTYNNLLNSKDVNGRMISEGDAAHAASNQAKKDFLPNFLMMSLGSGTLMRSKNIVKPTIGTTIKEGVFGAAKMQPFFTWQGFNDYSTMQEAQGKKTDLYDYMQSKDFRDNLVNGMIMGGGFSLIHAPGKFMKSMDNWEKMVHASEGEFKNLIPQNYSLGQEMAGNGHYLRDALKMHIFNADPEGLNEEGKRNLSDLKNSLLYSTNLDRNIRQGNLDSKNIKDLYQAHNLALADQHDYLSEQAAKEGNKSLSDIYKDKAKDYREQAKAASNGEAKYHYLVNEEGHPIFMSDKSFKVLEQEGIIAKWQKDGTIESVNKSDDPEFAQRYKDFVAAKTESTVEGTDILDHARNIIEQSKDKLGIYYSQAKEDPEGFLKVVADQALGYGRDSDGNRVKSDLPNAEQSMREMYGDDIVDTAKVMFPETEEEKGDTGSNPEPQGNQGERSDDGGYKPQIRDDYFVKADFFTPEEKEKFESLDDAGKDQMIDDKRADLKEKSGVSINYPGELKPPSVVPTEKNPSKISVIQPGELKLPNVIPTEKDPSKISVIQPGELKPPNIVNPETISSPIKTESDEKAEEAQGRKDVLTEKEGADKTIMKDDQAAPPSTPVPEVRTPAESPKEEFTAVRREKLKAIKGAKALFERQKVIKWTTIYDNALSNLQSMYPEKGLYDAMKARIGEFVAKLDSKSLFNPTSEDNAVFKVFRNETERRMSEIQGWDSSDNIQRIAAVAEWAVLQNDLYNIARVTNPEGETGRAFGLLQSEASIDPEHGLQIRRMELLGAKGGGKLTQTDLDFTAENWEKERALLEQEQELKQKGMQESFDKEMSKVKADYEKKLKDAKADRKPSTKSEREKSLKDNSTKIAENLKNFADKLEKFGRADLPEGTQRMGADIQKKVADAIRWVAEKIANGDIRIPDIINAAIEKFKGDDLSESELKGHISKGLMDAGLDNDIINRPSVKEATLDKIKKLVESTGDTDVTNDMAGKNLIRDYVNSLVGLHDSKDVLDVAHSGLQKVLPDLEKNRMLEAYLKQGEFKQKTKAELENGFKQAQKNFDRLAKLEKDINDLKDKGDLYKKTNNKPSPYDKDIERKEQEKKAVMDSMGVKTSGDDKYKKASYDQRAKSHNDRLDAIGTDIQNRIDKGDLSDKTQKSLIKLKNQLEAAKIKIDPSSALSQEKTMDGALSLLKSIKSEFQRGAEGDIAKIGDINRGLQRVIDKFSSDKEESEQNIKLQRAKDQAKREAAKFAEKISAGEYEDNPVVSLNKTDAELIKLQRNRAALEQLYKNKRREYERDNKSQVSKWANLARGAMVTSLIWKPFTLAKVAVSALTRPAFEAATKLIFGKGFEALPMTTTKAISERAKAGGESNSIESIKKGYEAYFRQYSPEQLKEKYTKANDAYEKADKSYIEQKAEVERVKYMGMDKPEYADAVEKMNKLKNVRNEALTEAIGNSMYQFIGGSSIKEALEVLLHRSTTMERQFGDFELEGFDAKNKISAENLGYVMNFVGRSHASLKNFSARYSFASGFMARIESAIENDVDIYSPDKILELAHQSYHDWERGKYQESNWISDAWNKATTAVENIGKEGSQIRSFGEGMAYLMKSDVAITRVPVNMLREGIMEYTLGVFKATLMAAREFYKAKGIVLQDGYTPESEAEFKNELTEQLRKMDPEKAAAIVRAFRKGGFGLGLYGLALLGHVAFGGWAHKGQTAEDAKKTKRDVDADNGIDEIKTGEVRIGDWKMPEVFAKIAEHAPQFAPLGFGLGLAQVYGNNIIDGKDTYESALNSAMAQVNHITGSIPQIDLVLKPLATGIYDRTKSQFASGQWDDVDQDGNPMKRKAFHVSDYLNYLPGFGDKKDVLSENYYKQAVSIQKAYREQITEVEINTSLTKEEKKEQRKLLLNQMKSDIDDVYTQNKENPQ